MRRKTDHARQRQLRRDQTEAERVLWQPLRDRRLLGWKFRRQHRIGPYFADFACVEVRLIVELDGSQHLTQQRHDDARTSFLETQGFRVLRFWNDDVLRDTEAVLATIATALAPHPPSAPSPRRRGEGKSEAVTAPFHCETSRRKEQSRDCSLLPAKRGKGKSQTVTARSTAKPAEGKSGAMIAPFSLRSGEKVPKADEGRFPIR